MKVSFDFDKIKNNLGSAFINYGWYLKKRFIMWSKNKENR